MYEKPVPLSGYAKHSVQLGLEQNVRITSTRDFFQHLLPLSDEASGAIPTIHERIKQKFWQDDRWANFPTEEDDDEKYAKDQSLYHQSFVELANEVCKACTEFGLVNDDCVQGAWVARPDDQSCENNGGTESFKALPNIAHVSQETSLAALDALDVAKASGSDSEEKKLEEACIRKVWWSQVRTPIEITTKPSDGTAMNKAVLQLCLYMHRILSDQLDRRFTFGILLCGEQLSLWFYDKSGLIGTLDPIHIHKDTMEFIRVLVALKTQSASRLGWDPTMKVYQSPTANGCPRDPIPSYRMVPEPADFTSITYQTNWVISMPTKDDPDQREDFVTIRHPISAHIIACSTATVVWEVVKLKDIDKPDRQIFILKQQWQPLHYQEWHKEEWKEREWSKKFFRQHLQETNQWDKLKRDKDQDPKPREAEMHDQAGIGDRIWSAELVPDDTASTLSVRAGFRDKTLECAVDEWERNLARNESQDVHDKSKSGDMTQPPQRLEHKPHLLLSSSGSLKYDIFFLGPSSHLKFKVQVRLLLVNVGFPLGTFLDLVELLQAIRGAVKDHEKLYFSGVLHRDVSTGNILIFPKESRNNGKDEDCGMLIDFDHANRTSRNRDLVIHEPPSEEQCAALEERFKSSVEFDREVLVHAWRYHGNMDTTKRFLKMLHYSQYGYETDEDDEDDLPAITMKQLGWETRHQWRTYVPKFDEHMDIVGTCYFLSARIANLRMDGGPWIHCVTDDTESFLWVIVFICMYYRGPGRERRQELESEDTELYKVMHEIFFGDIKDLRRTKDKLMKTPKLFKKMTLDRFHPYFDPLKGLVQKWYNIQRRLYALRRFDSDEEDHIHTYIQGLLDEALEEIERNPPEEEHPGTAKIRERRKKLLEEQQTLLRNVVPDPAHQPTSTNRKLGTLDADEDSEPARKRLRLSSSQEEGDVNSEGGPATQED